MDGPLFCAGAQTQIVIGEVIVRRISARKMYEVTRKAMEANPYALRLRHGEQGIRVPTTLHELAEPDSMWGTVSPASLSG